MGHQVKITDMRRPKLFPFSRHDFMPQPLMGTGPGYNSNLNLLVKVPLLPDPLWPGVVVLVKVPIIGQIDPIGNY